ncbi:MAG: flippase-like domain-containing protein [Chloroflexi bacterium]|nr:flippase-like domain-containing protein [Chloroflexota bacterium]
MTQTPVWKTNWFRIALGTLVSALFLYLALRDVPLEQVAETLARVNLGWVALAMLALFAQSFLRAIRWILLYYPQQRGLRVRQMTEIIIVSQMINIVSPWRIGELVRIVLADEIEKRSKAQSLATIGIEKIFDGTMLLALMLILPPFMTLPDWLESPREGLMIMSVALFVGAFVLMLVRERIVRLLGGIKLPWFRQSLDTHAEVALSSLDVFKHWNLHLGLHALSVTLWSLGVLINYIVLLAMNLDLPFISAFLLLAVLQVGGLVPSSPGKVGVFQALCILGLSLFGVDKGLGLTYGILLYLVTYAPMTLAGIALMWHQGLSFRRVVAGGAS